jgi:anti-sigma B factor antagonist
MADMAVTVPLNGRIDSGNAGQVEQDIMAMLAGKDGAPVVLDAAALDYISSAGLRVLLAAEQAMEEKGAQPVRVVNVNETVRDIFEITGFLDVLEVE